MKVLAILGLVLAVTLQANARANAHQELPKIILENSEQFSNCILQLGLETANLPKIEGVELLPEDNPVLNKLWGCMWEKKGIINQQGEVYPEKLRQYLFDLSSFSSHLNPEKMADEITDTCKDVEGQDYKEKSIKMQNCIIREVRKYE